MDFFENADAKLRNNGDFAEGDSLIPNDETDEIFGPYTKNEFINVSKVLNATNFFTFSPVPLSTYYWSIVRRNLEWYYGYVYGVHNKGILSTRTASKICRMSARLTLSGGFRFEGDEKASAFLSAYHNKNQTASKLKQKLPIHNAIGFTLGKVDIEVNGECRINFIQGNRYFAQTDDDGEVLAFYALIKVISADVKQPADENGEGYYLVEERYYWRDRPIQRYRIYKGPSIATAPVYGQEQGVCNKGIPFEELPKHVQNYIVRRFGENVLNRNYILPFQSLGAKIVLNAYSATGMDEYTCFSDSTIADVHAALYELDVTKTEKNESKYITQDFVAIPDTMIPPKEFRNDEARAIALERAQVAGFNKRIVKSLRYIDPSKAVPLVYQPQPKMQAYNDDINQILNEIAAGAQFSPITLAGYLKNGTEKTATEITADENATRLTIKDKRDLLSEAMNYLDNIVLKYYGFVDGNGCVLECSMIFNDGALSNPTQELDLLEKKQTNGWISNETAIMLANPQFSRKEAKEERDRILKENGGSNFYRGDSLEGILGNRS